MCLEYFLGQVVFAVHKLAFSARNSLCDLARTHSTQKEFAFLWTHAIGCSLQVLRWSWSWSHEEQLHKSLLQLATSRNSCLSTYLSHTKDLALLTRTSSSTKYLSVLDCTAMRSRHQLVRGMQTPAFACVCMGGWLACRIIVTRFFFPWRWRLLRDTLYY